MQPKPIVVTMERKRHEKQNKTKAPLHDENTVSWDPQLHNIFQP